MAHQWTGREVKAFRTHLRQTQVAFAAMLGAGSVKTVSDWENNYTIPSNSYCQVLDMAAIENDYSPEEDNHPHQP